MLSSLLNRLEEMHREVTNLTVFRTSPPIFKHEWMVGKAMLYTASAGIAETFRDAYQVNAIYTFRVDVLVKLFNMQTVDQDGESIAIADTHTWIETLYSYYNTHRDMTTTASPENRLTGLDPEQFMTMQCSGLLMPLAGTDDNAYIGTQFTLSVYTSTQYRT